MIVASRRHIGDASKLSRMLYRIAEELRQAARGMARR